MEETKEKENVATPQTEAEKEAKKKEESENDILNMAKNPDQAEILKEIRRRQEKARELVKNYINAFNEDPDHPDPKKKADFETMMAIAKASSIVFEKAFKIHVSMWEEFVIVLCETWKLILEELGKLPGDSGAMNVHGLQVQYTTQLGEGDKPRNIVPEIIHQKKPVFIVDEEEKSSDKTHEKQEYLNKFARWRDQNTSDQITSIETKIDSMLHTEFGLKLVCSAQVLPMCAVMYAVAIEKAAQAGKPINFFNLMTITIRDGRICIEPSSVVKQYIKNDDKFDKRH